MSKGWTADEVLALGRNYQSACVVAAAADLDLFTVLAGRPVGATEAADALRADVRATTILLDAIVSLGLLEKHGERYVVPSTAAALLTRDAPGSALPMIQHQANCLRRWADLARVVRTGRPVERQPSIRGEAADDEAFIGAMHTICDPVAARVIAEIQPIQFTHLLDVGGASGTWTIEWLRVAPDATATLFDLPSVIPLADRRLRECGLRDRVELVAGDYLTDSLPKGADLAWVSAIVHQNGREENRRLYSAVHDALDEGGLILIRDILMEPSRTSPAMGALFAVNMLVATESGGTYTFDEIREDLEASGFADVRVLRREEGMSCVVGGRKT